MYFVLSSFRCYTNEAVAGNKRNERAARPEKRAGMRGKRAEHLENYIVQETKNKPVILRQEHCKVLKLKNENNATNLSERTK